MKCFIVLSLVALCSAYPYGTGYGSGYGYGSWFGGLGKNLFINQDGSMSLITGTGKTITISKVPGQSNVVISPIPSEGLQKYWYKGYWPTQVDTLSQILTPYQGEVSPVAFQQLLGDINSAVQSGQLSDSIYQVMQKWNPWGYGSQLPIQQFQQQLPIQQFQQQLPLDEVLQQPIGIQEPITPVVGQQVPVFPYSSWGSYGYGGLTGFGQQPWEAIKYGTGSPLWNPLSSGLWSGPWAQFGQYPVGPIEQIIPAQLSQVVQKENQILNQQYQIQQQQTQQQQQLLVQQLQQQQLQQEQKQVLGQQQLQYMTFWNMLKGLWQQPAVLPQGGLYGAWGQGMQGNMPMVF